MVGHSVMAPVRERGNGAGRGVPARATIRDGRVAAIVEAVVLPLGAIAVSFALFGVFVALAGASVGGVYYQMYRGAFGSWFSLQNSMVRAAPIMLTALCTALPAQVGLVIIGGE